MTFFNWLFGKKSSIKLKIPKGLELIQDESKIRFKGNADDIISLSKELEKVSSLNEGEFAILMSFKFFASSTPVPNFNPDEFYLPANAWGIMSAKFREVATSWEDSPFDFNNCGYINPPLERDIGIELIGDPYPR